MPEAEQTAPELVPARMLNEYVYCPRLAYIEWVEGDFRDNAYTVDGRNQHRRVDQRQQLVKPAEDSGVDEDVVGEGRTSTRSVYLAAHALGLVAKIAPHTVLVSNAVGELAIRLL